MTEWTNPQYAGPYLPMIFNEGDPRTAQEQANHRYDHGGGWNSFNGRGFELKGTADKGFQLAFPGDPHMRELSRTQFHEQLLVLFECSWMAIIEDGKMIDVARID